MIISKIIGGLGNQMFQYAAGRALAAKFSQDLKLDISGFDTYGLHNGYELDRIFACRSAIANESDLRGVLGWQFSGFVRKLIARPSLAVFRGRSYLVEPHFHYWPEILNAPKRCYLDGYWQSEKYFGNITSIIRADFTFINPLSGLNLEIAADIERVISVSLHIRRGDYVTNANNCTTYGSCEIDYYKKTIQHIADRIKRPTFFIFSDDIEWVKINLNTEFPCRYISNNHGKESYNDMRLMSLCQHHIIANSSFSWWGAWLNPRTDKIVIAPRTWFVNKNSVKDLFPQGWIVL